MITIVGVILVATAMIIFSLLSYFWKIRVQSYLRFMFVVNLMVLGSLGIVILDIPETESLIAVLSLVIIGLMYMGYQYNKLIGAPYQSMYAKLVRAVDDKNLDIGTRLSSTTISELQTLELKQTAFIEEMSNIIRSVQRNQDVIDGYLENLDKQSTTMGNEIDKITDDVDQILQNAAVISEQIDTIRNQGIDFLNRTESNFDILIEINKSADRITDQTNIIAVNAAIEASQTAAEESNFSTVADSILGLSQRSRETTDKFQANINELKRSIIREIEDMNKKLTKLEDSIFELGELANRSSSFTHQQHVYANEINAIAKQAKKSNNEFKNLTKQYQLE